MSMLPFLLLAAQLVIQNQQPAPEQEPPGSLSGQVVNSETGEPVQGAQVMVQPFDSRVPANRTMSSDAGGAFSATGLPPGQYVINASHWNYTGILSFPQPTATARVTSGSETPGVVVRLMPGASISGRVVDDGGEPAENCSMVVLSPQHLNEKAAFQSRGWGQTNDQGEFRIAGLTADRYILHARCPENLPVEKLLYAPAPPHRDPRESWMPVYFPDSPTVSGATVFNLLPGTEVQGVEFKLKATPVTTLTVRTVLPPGVSAEGQANVHLLPEDSGADPSQALGGYFDRETGTVRITMVPPGAYRLSAWSGNPGQPESMAYAEQHLTTDGLNPEQLTIQFQPTLTLSGTVVDPPASDTISAVGPAGSYSINGNRLPGAPVPKGFLQFEPLSSPVFGGWGQTEVHQDGSFDARGLSPGRWRIHYQPAQTQGYIESVQYGETRFDSDEFEIATGGVAALRIHLRAKFVPVKINLPSSTSSAKTTWAVYLIKAGKEISFNQPGNMTMGRSGDNFPPMSVPPGRYLVIAIEQSQFGGANARLLELLASRVEPVEIAAGGEASVTPKAVTSDEIYALALGFLRGDTQ